MTIVKKLADHLDMTEYELFELAAKASEGSQFINVVTDYTLYVRRGFIPTYVYGYDRKVRCAA